VSNLNSAFALVANTLQEAKVLPFTHCMKAAPEPFVDMIAWSCEEKSVVVMLACVGIAEKTVESDATKSNTLNQADRLFTNKLLLCNQSVAARFIV